MVLASYPQGRQFSSRMIARSSTRTQARPATAAEPTIARLALGMKRKVASTMRDSGAGRLYYGTCTIAHLLALTAWLAAVAAECYRRGTRHGDGVTEDNNRCADQNTLHGPSVPHGPRCMKRATICAVARTMKMELVTT